MWKTDVLKLRLNLQFGKILNKDPNLNGFQFLILLGSCRPDYICQTKCHVFVFWQSYKAFRVLACKESWVKETQWNLTPLKLNAFIAILYACALYRQKIKIFRYLGNSKWVPAFFLRKPCPGETCVKLFGLTGWAKKSQLSQRLQTDKFVLPFEVFV